MVINKNVEFNNKDKCEVQDVISTNRFYFE